MPRHHYSSKFYYKSFTCNTQESLVHAMRRNGTLVSRQRPIRKICSEVDYNTKVQEQHQNRLETKYKKVLRDFIKRAYHGEYDCSEEFGSFVSFMIDNDDSKKIIRFIGFMIGINKHTRQIVLNAVGDSLEGNLDISVDRDYRGKGDLSSLLFERIYDKFKTWEFMGIKKKNNTKIFITSDKPVTIFNPSDRTISVDGSLEYNYGDIKQIEEPISIPMNIANVSFEGNAAIVFPISPSVCVVGFPEPRCWESYVSNFGDDILDHVNFITHAGCMEHLFSHSKRVLEITRDKVVYNLSNKGW